VWGKLFRPWSWAAMPVVYGIQFESYKESSTAEEPTDCWHLCNIMTSLLIKLKSSTGVSFASYHFTSMPQDISVYCYCSSCSPAGRILATRSCRRHLGQDETELAKMLQASSSITAANSATVVFLQSCIQKTKDSILSGTQQSTIPRMPSPTHFLDESMDLECIALVLLLLCINSLKLH
jgi:hypothetical protein